jgi:lambda repressor-like predicted transcriptional regulator
MKPAEIRGTLVTREITNTEIARECGVSPTMVGHVIKGKRKPLHIRLAIARRLGMDIRDIWPEETRHLKKER